MSKKSNSRISKNNNLYITQQQRFNFEEFEDNMDDTFLLEYKNINKNQKKEKQREINKALQKELKQELRERKQKNRNCTTIVLLSLLLIISGMSLFMIYHFTTFKHNETKIKIKEVPIVDDNYLFLGDSITEQYDLKKHYKDLSVVNSGISGNITNDILNSMKERVYRYNPSKVLLLIGTNDIERGKEEDEIVDNIEKIILNIKENRKYAKIYVESIYPVDEDKDGAESRKNSTIVSINKKLKKVCATNEVTYIDLYNLLIDNEDNNLKDDYSEDGLHLNDKGYEKVTKTIKTYLKK